MFERLKRKHLGAHCGDWVFLPVNGLLLSWPQTLSPVKWNQRLPSHRAFASPKTLKMNCLGPKDDKGPSQFIFRTLGRLLARERKAPHSSAGFHTREGDYLVPLSLAQEAQVHLLTESSQKELTKKSDPRTETEPRALPWCLMFQERKCHLIVVFGKRKKNERKNFDFFSKQLTL